MTLASDNFTLDNSHRTTLALQFKFNLKGLVHDCLPQNKLFARKNNKFNRKPK